MHQPDDDTSTNGARALSGGLNRERLESLSSRASILGCAERPPAKSASNGSTDEHEHVTEIGRVQPAEGDAETYRRTLEKIETELGQTLLRLIIEDNGVSEIDRNPDGRIFVTQSGKGKWELTEGKITHVAARNLIRSVASVMGMEMSHRFPTVEGTLPINHCRFTGMLPPVVSGGPMFSIRKRSVLKFTFDDYIKNGTLTAGQAAHLREHIRRESNILIVGPTHAGKTTFANAVLAEIHKVFPDKRLAVLEDTAELQGSHVDSFYLLTSKTANKTMDDLLQHTMRVKPEIICVGELRGPEAQTLVEAWNTGHDGGVSTIHSDTPEKALSRLESLIRKAGVPAEKVTIQQAVNVIVVLKEVDGRRVCTDIAYLADATETGYTLRKFKE